MAIEYLCSGIFSANLSAGAVYSGKNLRNSLFIWFWEARSTLIWTSALPALRRAGSKRSLWLVVMKRILPSVDLTPSIALRRPEKETDRPCCFYAENLSTNTASMSSKSTIDLLGVDSKSLLRPSSSSLSPERLTVHRLRPSSPARARMVLVFPVPGGPWRR